MTAGGLHSSAPWLFFCFYVTKNKSARSLNDPSNQVKYDGTGYVCRPVLH